MTGTNKIILLIAGFVLALLICYQFAISRTIALKQEYETLKNQEVLFENTHKQMALLKQKQHYYDSLLSRYHRNNGSLQNNLLKSINSFADSTNLRLVNFLEPHIVNSEEIKISTFHFILEGDFNAILRFVHLLEQDSKLGEITNLHFEKKMDYKRGKYYLQASILLKSFG